MPAPHRLDRPRRPQGEPDGLRRHLQHSEELGCRSATRRLLPWCVDALLFDPSPPPRAVAGSASSHRRRPDRRCCRRRNRRFNELRTAAADADDALSRPARRRALRRAARSLPGATAAPHSEYQGGYDEILHDGKMRHKSIDLATPEDGRGAAARRGRRRTPRRTRSARTSSRSPRSSCSALPPARREGRRQAAAAEAAAAAAASSGGAGHTASPRRDAPVAPTRPAAPPARRVSLTFRPGEGLLTGLDGRVEEIEPNFDLNV